MSKTSKFIAIPIVEKDAFVQSVTQVATAIPAFIGYTQKAVYKDQSLFNQAILVYSFTEFIQLYGGAPPYTFDMRETTNENGVAVAGKLYEVVQEEESRYWLYNSIRLFFENGGGACYVVSVGGYNQKKNAADFYPAIDLLKNVQAVTLLVIPELMLLSEQECAKLQQYMIAHCESMGNRMALLDIYNGYELPGNGDMDVIAQFRKNLPVSGLNFAAAYYPWLDTSICSTSEVSFRNIGNIELLKQLLLSEAATRLSPDQHSQFQLVVSTLTAVKDVAQSHETLMNLSPFYKGLVLGMLKQLNRLSPAAAMAGIYTRVDAERGVWKAPANTGLKKVNAPTVKITDQIQADLNVPLSGKAINAIRSFIGEGVLVWGARTCDGNSPDWRYVNVRRTVIMIEQSIKNALASFVFEPNEPQTWQTINMMTQNFLNSLWKEGALAGSSPADAYTVQIGMGSTMTGDDVLNGILRLNVAVAVARPAEFIVLTFVQQMQTATG